MVAVLRWSPYMPPVCALNRNAGDQIPCHIPTDIRAENRESIQLRSEFPIVLDSPPIAEKAHSKAERPIDRAVRAERVESLVFALYTVRLTHTACGFHTRK